MIWVRRLLWLFAAGIGLLLAFITAAGVYFSATAPSPKTLEQADAIIVLSAGLDRDGALDIFSSARVEKAVTLYQAGVAPRLLMSGGLNKRTGKVLSIEMLAHAKAQGLPGSAFFIEGRSLSTFENTRFSLEIAHAAGWNRLVLVTDGFHLMRAWALFEYWRRADDAKIIALVPADGLSAAGPFRSVLVLLREALAYPFNIAKLLGHQLQRGSGLGGDRLIR
ncbi:MAG: YdcF family protein [Neomegalonema sp.]|nr:YdcF family protein [Neomegalonema sp.]